MNKEAKFQEQLIEFVKIPKKIMPEKENVNRIIAEVFEREGKTKLISDCHITIFFNPSITGANKGTYDYDFVNLKFIEAGPFNSLFTRMKESYKKIMDDDDYREVNLEKLIKIKTDQDFYTLNSEGKKIYLDGFYMNSISFLGLDIDTLEIKDSSSPIRFKGEGFSGVLATITMSLNQKEV